jgi:hypothetical protein
MATIINMQPRHSDAFTQFKFSYNKVDFMWHRPIPMTHQREGLYKMEFTKPFLSEKVLNFENFGFKTGLHLKFLQTIIQF